MKFAQYHFFIYLSLTCMVLGACATMPETPRFSTISLEKTVHFEAPDGRDVTVVPGSYDVQMLEEAKLQLAPAEAITDKQPITVQAQSMPHAEALSSAVALSVPQGEDGVHVVLLLPNGRGWDAPGSLSGVRTRSSTAIPASTIQQYLARKLVTRTAHRD
jgi:hypothetical protein